MPVRCSAFSKPEMIDLSPRHLATVKSILAEHVPECEVRAYGSRATWTARDYSDVDLAVVGKGPLDREVIADLKEAFQDSDLPMRVDVLDWHGVSEEFRDAIKAEMVVLSVRGSDRSHVATLWQEARLGDVVRLISGGTPSKRRAAYWNGAIPWASARDMKQFRLRDTIHHVTAEGLANGTKQVPVGTLLLLTRGMRLLKELPVCVTQRPMAFNQDVKALLPKDRIDRSFLAYLVLGNKHRLLNLVDLAGHGTGRINSDELRALDVRLPPKPEQRAIAGVLGTLDDKIELNRRINETLEAMARALFKSWFVDFDPVRAKMEGQETGLPAALADLFPDRLVDSELGFIPEGWRVTTLGDLIELAYGKSLPHRKRKPGNVPVYGSNGQVGWHDERLIDGPGIIVGRKGNPGVVKWSQKPFFPIDTTFYVVPRDTRCGLFFLFHLLRTQDLPSIASDSAVPGVNRNLAYMNRAIVPPADVVEAFSTKTKTIAGRQDSLTSESGTLAALRDTLLPKLIAGEIRVPDAERVAAPVT